METALALFLILTLGIAAAVISLLEVLVSHLRTHRAAALGRERPELAPSLHRLAESREPLLGALVILGAILTLGVAGLALYLFYEVALPAGAHPGWTIAGAFVVAVVLGDLLPKFLGLSAPAKLLSWIARPLARALPLLLGLARALRALGDWLASLVVPEEKTLRALVEVTELETLVEMRLEAGALTEDEAEIILEILKLSKKTAKDCMTPRLDAAFLDADLDPVASLALVRASGHRYLPVYRGDLDGVIGILDVRDFLESGELDTAPFIRAPLFVPEVASALQLFQRQLLEPHSLAVVLDEYGNVEGVVTHSDVIEEILEDAAPSSEAHVEIQPLGAGRYLASGAARIDEIEELTGLHLGGQGLDTLGGLLFNHLGHIPRRASRHELDGMVLTVRKLRRNRIEELLVEIAGGAGDPGEMEERRERTP